MARQNIRPASALINGRQKLSIAALCGMMLVLSCCQLGQSATKLSSNISTKTSKSSPLTSSSIEKHRDVGSQRNSDDLFVSSASNDEPEVDSDSDPLDTEADQPGESSEGADEPPQDPRQLAAQKEREAALAQEADETNRAALDEQQAQQARIIQEQSRAEAQAVIDQRNALSKQQETLMQGQLKELDEPRMQRAHAGSQWPAQSRRHANYATARQPDITRPNMDIQFSDHDSPYSSQKKSQRKHQAAVYQSEERELDTDASDLIPAAQYHHNYGAHYGSLHKHQHGKYYQFAESHKKGQYKAGFKRGNKKFHISGHSAQHKSHANGHVKWHGKKGKGSHHWDYKHKDKKHHKHHY